MEALNRIDHENRITTEENMSLQQELQKARTEVRTYIVLCEELFLSIAFLLSLYCTSSLWFTIAGCHFGLTWKLEI